jgi:phytol kinase
LSFALGKCVLHLELRVNYSRKILSISFFLISSFLLVQSAFNPFGDYYWLNKLASFSVPLIWLGSFMAPIRKKISFFATCFSSIDRPEDRPHTLSWLVTSLIAGYWVLVVTIEILKFYDSAYLIFIVIFVSTFGDGLAEPIGIKYGRNSYKARALFTKKTYIRTLEGSACVFISGVSAVLAMYPYLSPVQLLFLLVSLPISMTVTEALSPHTWDNPFLHLVGGGLIVAAVTVLV